MLNKHVWFQYFWTIIIDKAAEVRDITMPVLLSRNWNIYAKNSEPVTKPDGNIECVRCCDVKESRSDIFLAEVQNNLTGTLMASQSDCSTSVSEHVCTNLAHSLLSCSLELCV